MKRALFASAVAALVVGASEPALADTGTTCRDGVCWVSVTDNGSSGGSASGANSSGDCTWQGNLVPCETSSGYFDPETGCYFREADPYPTSGPIYLSWIRGGGAIYWTVCPFDGAGGGYVWLPTPPAGFGPTPAMLARRALDSVVLSKPMPGRYPNGTLDDATPYTAVRAWTWFWTDPATFKPLTARASAGAVWAEVRIEPAALTFLPGDGNSAVSCSGPGTVWTSAFGPWDPSPSGCDYRYPHSSVDRPGRVVTATYAIQWRVSWTGSGGTAGTLPDQSSTTTATFAVVEAQTVVTK